MKVLIVGAGIAGLAAAIFFKQKGVEVKIIEKTAKPSHRGFIIFLYPNVLPMLDKLNIKDHVLKESEVFGTHMIYSDKKQKLGEVDFSKFKASHPGETIILKRDVLNSNLVKKFGEENIDFGKELREVDEKEDYIEAIFNDGTKEKFDFVIGADGIDSEMRYRYFSADETLSYDAYTYIYWLDKKFEVPANTEEYVGQDSSLMIFRVNKDLGAVYLGLNHTEKDKRFIDKDLLIEKFKNYISPIPEIVASMPDDYHEYYKTAIRHIKTKEWYRGRMVLIGDAIHGTSPLTGFGSTMALQDAYVLSEELTKKYDSFYDALENFKKRRERIVHKVQRFTDTSMEIGNVISDRGMFRLMGNFNFLFTSSIEPLLYKSIDEILQEEV